MQSALTQALGLTLRGVALQQGASVGGLRWLPQAFSSAASVAVPSRGKGDVPPGHLASDLSPVACNIGLGRRRDLTLRQDLCLYQQDGKKTSLTDVLRADKLNSHGVDKVVAVTVDTPENVKELATKHNLKCSKMEVLADKNGGLMRLLGVEIAPPDAPNEPRCQRFAAIVEDGILLKLRVEQKPADLQVSDCKSMLELWRCVYPQAASA